MFADLALALLPSDPYIAAGDPGSEANDGAHLSEIVEIAGEFKLDLIHSAVSFL